MNGNDKYKKNQAKLERLCKKKTKDTNRKALCLMYENSKIEEESHTHTPLWIWIIFPYAFGLIMTILSQVG